MSLPRPALDMAPRDFFERWLPEQAARLDVLAAGAPEVHLRVTLEGAGGGAWDVRVREGKLAVGAPGGGEPHVAVLQSVDDWRALVLGDEGGQTIAPPGAQSTDLLFVDPMARQMLQAVRGTVEFRITNYRGRTWKLRVKFGPQPMAEEPTSTITVDADTYAAMAARKLPPPEAYFSGKIQIGGDPGLAMQIGMAMLPRFQS